MSEDSGYGARSTAEEDERERREERRIRSELHNLILGEPKQPPLVCCWCFADWPFHLDGCPGKMERA